MSRSTKSWTFGVAVLTAVTAAILVYFLLSSGPARAKQFATLGILQGSVEVQRGSTGPFSEGHEGQSLSEGDTIRTGDDGRAEISYFDGSLTRLDFNTTYKLQELATLKNAASSKRIFGTQSTGRTWSRVTKLADSQSRFQVKTPTATASVRGTTFAVQQ